VLPEVSSALIVAAFARLRAILGSEAENTSNDAWCKVRQQLVD
jgi:hypothetical protein